MKPETISYTEEELIFEPYEAQAKGLFDDDNIPEAVAEPEFFGLKIRIGNKPVVRNLKKLIELSNQQLPPEVSVLFENYNIFTVTHAIGVIQISGNASLNELQFNGEIVDADATTIDLLPDTAFKSLLSINGDYEAAMKAGGSFSAKLPNELTNALSGKSISLGGDIDLHLSSNTQFVGKISASIKFPLIIATGKNSSHCSWVIKRDQDPLLGDQLLIQTVAVAKTCTAMTYKVKATAKVKHGFFKKDSIDTTTISLIVTLDN
ncbi:hypothetical protein [Mucilaginibacter lappiensis]|uniref:hypothetical protein n=1 Tax=Mucilaginibacter lappiensis TaxID=354630 RepID=UPI003D204E6A